MLVELAANCRGCSRCELSCSLYHNKTLNPDHSEIYTIHNDPFHTTPVVCVQCGLCAHVCPIQAIKKNTKTGAFIVTDKCNGCGQCISACPYGVIRIDSFTRKAAKCDLCNGDPRCVRICPHNALVYAEPEKARLLRRTSTAMAKGMPIFTMAYAGSTLRPEH